MEAFIYHYDTGGSNCGFNNIIYVREFLTKWIQKEKDKFTSMTVYSKLNHSTFTSSFLREITYPTT